MDTQYYIHNGNKILAIPPIDDICKIIKIKFDKYQETEKQLREELNKIKNEKWKDKELLKMKEEIETMKKEYYNGFPLSDEQLKKINEWKDKHEEEKHSSKLPYPRGGAIGGSYQYIFTPTSIGTFGTIKCSCGDTFDFQDGMDF